MKEYTLKLTDEQLTKLNIFLIQYLPKVEENIKVYKELSTQYENFDTKTLDIFKSNSSYYKTMFEELTKLHKKIDQIPF